MPRKCARFPDVEQFASKARVSLVDQGGRLQRVIRTLLAKIGASEAAQLVIDQGQNRLQRLAVPVPPVEEKFADLPGRSWTHVGVSGHSRHRGDDAGRIVKSRSEFNTFYSIR